MILLHTLAGSNARINSRQFYRKGIQTSTYEMVKGSYIPAAQHKQDSLSMVAAFWLVY